MNNNIVSVLTNCKIFIQLSQKSGEKQMTIRTDKETLHRPFTMPHKHKFPQIPKDNKIKMP